MAQQCLNWLNFISRYLTILDENRFHGADYVAQSEVWNEFRLDMNIYLREHHSLMKNFQNFFIDYFTGKEILHG